ncbi:Uncharacterised protein [Mycobacteroides abscessus subsp. abscessus]|nr:Uncharacterised protein [Mycobacteroides abscessus subsp. abscessus]SIL09275.1 Uncharacterised protein [Mycobacteroides abscessus subsp. abscessus]SLK59108.1 Uncharacterised protein [Mycobacteroides abscessus subsp. abscessus]
MVFLFEGLVKPNFVNDPDCEHRSSIFIESTRVEDAWVLAYRCNHCGEILGTASTTSPGYFVPRAGCKPLWIDLGDVGEAE